MNLITLKIVIKRMEELDLKFRQQELLNKEEREFYDAHLQTVKQYYSNKWEYWRGQLKYTDIFECPNVVQNTVCLKEQ